MIALEIPRVPVSLNELLRYGWRHRHRNSQLWQVEINVALTQTQQRLAQPYEKAKVSIERRARGTLDPDNLAGAVKPIVDALRYAGILRDDSPRHLQLTLTQMRSALPPQTRIEIEPLEIS